MASMTMVASFLGGSISYLTKKLSLTNHRSLIVHKALEGEKGNLEFNCKKEEKNGERKDLVLATVAAAACPITKVAMAEEELKVGTVEAKKKYAPVCVTMLRLVYVINDIQD